MNLIKLAPAWNHFKKVNSLTAIPEAEIFSAIESEKSDASSMLLKRVVQNVFAYSFLMLMLHGGCTV